MKDAIKTGLTETAVFTVEKFVEYVGTYIESPLITMRKLESIKENFIKNVIPKTHEK